MTNKDIQKKWNKFFKYKLDTGFNWDQIKHDLILRGYIAEQIDAQIQAYKYALKKKKKTSMMMIIIIFLALLITIPFIIHKPTITGMPIGVGGDIFYVDATNGDDSNDGSSPANAIKTITKVNTLTLDPGDSVLFKCGDIWRVRETGERIRTDNGATGNYITYSSYGECTNNNKPLFLGSINLSNASAWTNTTATLWKYTGLTVPEDIAQLSTFDIPPNRVTVFGSHHYLVSSLVSQGDFAFNDSANTLWVYSESNPATYYGSIEAWIDDFDTEMVMDAGNWIIIENMSFRFIGDNGIALSANNVIIRNLDIGYGGGGWQPGQVGTLEYGNGISIQEDANNVLITNNRVYDWFDAGISIQAWTCGHDHLNSEISYNIIYNNRYGWEYFNWIDDCSANYGITNNISVHHNTFAYQGQGWRSSIAGKDLRYGTATPLTSNYSHYDNIFYSTDTRNIELEGDGDHYNWMGTYPQFDYNLYYPNKTNYIRWENIYYSTVAAFHTGEAMEANGKGLDPMFSDPTNYNFTPASNSPACNMSSTGSYVGALPCEGAAPYCGDGSCNGVENCSSCSADCGSCPPANTPPTHSNPILNASDKPYNTSDATLNCYNQSTFDADNDSVTNIYHWFRNNTLMSSLSTNTVGAGNTSVGDSWKCEITPYDGTDYGIARNSTALTITQLPDTVLVKLNSTTVNNYSNENLTCYANTTGFMSSMTVFYRMYNGSSLYVSGNKSVTKNTLSIITNISSTLLISNQTWKCSIKSSYDGIINESEWNNASITMRTLPYCGDGSCNGAENCSTCESDCGVCANTPPTQSNPILNASDYPLNSTNATLNCYNQSTADADGDIVTNYYSWFRNNTLMSSLSTNSVGAGNTSVGDSWKCEITPYDGTDYGIAKNSSALTIRAVCNNGVCESGETCNSCSADCGTCPFNNNITACNLSDKSWDEDSMLVNAYNLSTCFNDPLNTTLNYSSIGNSSINVSIGFNGSVNLSAATDWNGVEHVIFIARSGNRSAQSNNVTLTVNAVADCGNAVCESGETCNSCSVDCGACPPSGGGSSGGGGYLPPSNTTINVTINNTVNVNNSNKNITELPVINNENNTILIDNTSLASNVEEPKTLPNEETPSKNNTNFFIMFKKYILIYSIVLISFLVTIIIIIRNSKQVLIRNDMTQYIISRLNYGYTYEAIRKSLKSKNISNSDINENFHVLRMKNHAPTIRFKKPVIRTFSEEGRKKMFGALYKFVKNQQDQGFSLKDIKKMLENYGHSKDIVEEVIKKIMTTNL